MIRSTASAWDDAEARCGARRRGFEGKHRLDVGLDRQMGLDFVIAEKTRQEGMVEGGEGHQ